MATRTKSESATCLRPEGLKFLRGLKRNNDRDWFNARKDVFEAEIKLPMLEIIDHVNRAMERFAPAYVRPATKCLFRIYRDTRFSADKKPYKDHTAAWWMPEGFQKTSGAGFYFHISPVEVVIAAGAWMPDKDQLALIRNWMLDNHASFRKQLNKPAVKETFAEFEGNRLTRAPKGYDEDHPAIDLVRCRQWGLSVSLPAEAALEAGFADVLARHFKLATPVVEALNTPLLAARTTTKKVLFGLPGMGF